VLLQAENVREVSVFASKHPIMGSVVGARLSLYRSEDIDQVKIRLRKFCQERLAKFKTPVKFEIVEADALHSERFKKVRSNEV
jgi:long-chain acyl-CoA synthetase